MLQEACRRGADQQGLHGTYYLVAHAAHISASPQEIGSLHPQGGQTGSDTQLITISDFGAGLLDTDSCFAASSSAKVVIGDQSLIIGKTATVCEGEETLGGRGPTVRVEVLNMTCSVVFSLRAPSLCTSSRPCDHKQLRFASKSVQMFSIELHYLDDIGVRCTMDFASSHTVPVFRELVHNRTVAL